jgi:hypothetical protein
MKRISMAVAAFAIVASNGMRLAAEETFKAGLQPGDKIGGFNIKECAGPDESTVGKSFCYSCKFGSKPVVNIFTKTMDKNVVALVKKLDEQMQKDESLRGYVVVLTENEDEMDAKLKEVWKEAGLKKLALTTFGTMAGPPKYKIKKDAEVSVHTWNKQTVKDSWGFKKADEITPDTIKTIVAATKKLTAAEGVASN